MNMSISVSHSELMFVFSRSCYSLGLPAGISDDVGFLASFIAKIGLDPCSSLNQPFSDCEALKNNPAHDINITEKIDLYIFSSKTSSQLSSLACGPILQDWLEKDKYIMLKKIDNPVISFLFLVALTENNNIKNNIHCQFGENYRLLLHQSKILSNFPLFCELKDSPYNATINISDKTNLKDYSHQVIIPPNLKNLKACKTDDKLWQVFLSRFKKSLIDTIDNSGAGA